MEQNKVIKFMQENKNNFFPNDDHTEEEVMIALMEAPDSFEATMNRLPMRNPTLVSIVAFLVGSFGVDRFYLGDFKKGILKFITAGGMLIWWFVDVISAKKRCRKYNCENLLKAVHDPAVLKGLLETDAKINKAVETGKKWAPVAKEVVKGGKEIRDSFTKF